MKMDSADMLRTVLVLLAVMLVLLPGLYVIARNPHLTQSTTPPQTQQANLLGQYDAASQDQYGNLAFQAPALLENEPDSAPICLDWYQVRDGDTQWSIARRFTDSSAKLRWMKSMRKMSGKSVNDERLKPGEHLCVHWR